jgi:hypothetical protein
VHDHRHRGRVLGQVDRGLPSCRRGRQKRPARPWRARPPAAPKLAIEIARRWIGSRRRPGDPTGAISAGCAAAHAWALARLGALAVSPSVGSRRPSSGVHMARRRVGEQACSVHEHHDAADARDRVEQQPTPSYRRWIWRAVIRP